MSDSTAGATATHLIGFTINVANVPLGSIKIQYCSNNPLPDTSCDAPVGMDTSGVTLANQTGNTGFGVSSLTTSNTVILKRLPAIPFPYGVPNTYQLDNIVNPSSAGSYYIRLYIYQTTDASGPVTEEGGIAIAINNGLSVSAGVPPYLEFCTGLKIVNFDCSTATGYSIDFGDLSSNHVATGTSQFVVATNATSGYNVTVSGTTLTSGNNVISALASPSISNINSNQFGINLKHNTVPNVGADPVGSGSGSISSGYDTTNRFMYRDGDLLVSTPTVSDSQNFTISYLTNINSGDPPGVYTTTLTLICLANF